MGTHMYLARTVAGLLHRGKMHAKRLMQGHALISHVHHTAYMQVTTHTSSNLSAAVTQQSSSLQPCCELITCTIQAHRYGTDVLCLKDYVRCQLHVMLRL